MLLGDLFQAPEAECFTAHLNSLATDSCMSLAEVIVQAGRVYLSYRRLHPTPDEDLWWDANFRDANFASDVH